MYYTPKEVYQFVSEIRKDPITERKTCEVSGTKFPIYKSDLDFYDKISPTFNGKKYKIPTPKLCPEERERRRMSWRNERKLFKRKCDATGEDMISMHTPDTKFPVYNAKIWRSNNWNSMKYGIKINKEKRFFEQFKDLLDNVPNMSMYNINFQNSDYCNCSLNMKNCYLISGAIGDEECLYGNYMDYCNFCVDNLMVFSSELCYECIDCLNCYGCNYCQNTKECKNSSFLYNCEHCEFCFGCVNLIDKKYHIFNKKYSKQDWKDEMEKIKTGSYQEIENLKKKFDEFCNKFPKKATIGKNNINCIGNNPLSNSKNCFKCFDADDLEDCKYLYWFRKSKNCYDVFSFGSPSEMLYECVAIGTGASKCIACTNIDNSHNCYYSIQCSYSHHLFGCNGLRNAKYCIFNKQYSPQEWEEKVEQLVINMKKSGEWGEMLNQKLSSYPYNYSVAQEFFPLERQEAKKLGYNRSDYLKPELKGGNIVNANNLPDSIEDIDESITNKIIICKKSGKGFRITKQELNLYKKQNISIPRLHPDIRYQERLNKRPARKLYIRDCDKSGKKIISVYPQDSIFEVYSEESFDQYMYG